MSREYRLASVVMNGGWDPEGLIVLPPSSVKCIFRYCVDVIWHLGLLVETPTLTVNPNSSRMRFFSL